MDAVEEWLRAKAEAQDDRHDRATIIDLADEWAAVPPVAVVPYEAPSPLADFLEHVDGPAMIGLDPVIYPACTRCSHAWKLCRNRGVWAWYPDCAHKATSCKLIHCDP